MISNINEIYERVAEKNGLDLDLVKSVGSTNFKHFKDTMYSMEESSIWLSNVGAFILKSKKIENQVRRWLEVRRYLMTQSKDAYNYHISKKFKRNLALYLNKIGPYKKAKAAHKQKKIDFCKKMVESYKNEEDTNKDT